MDKPSRYRTAAAIAHALQSVSPAEQAREVEARCGDDLELRAIVQHLLRQESERTIATGPDGAERVGASAKTGDEPTVHNTSPMRVGAYTILELIGEGGMGAVYLAQQDRPRRVVALKLVRPGLMTPRMLRRFEHESEMLARLQHPGIAQIYEAGAAETPHGTQPYFAMEYIRGTPLTAFAREHGLTTRQKLAMFIRICEAVHHAHQKGVIHRDLKPGNVLIQTPEGTTAEKTADSAQPKILDFGIARSTDGDMGQQTLQTEAGQLLGTIPYMSPEQVSCDPNAIDTRSDVYTLGVMLYELLVGKLPHAVSDKTIPDAVRTISQDAPTPLSVVDRALRGDIQTIVGKALEKDRTRRYQSASELGLDLQRYLRDEPILARPPSRAYQFRKFAARNRAVVVGATAAVLLLIGGIVATSTQAVRAEAAREQAREEADLAKSANEFLTGMLAAANPDQNNERELTVREMVDRAAEQLARQESTERTRPRVAMSLHNTLSSTYRSLGKADEAVAQAERAVALAEATRGKEDLDTIDAKRTLAMALTERARFDEAESVTRECLAALERRLGPKHVDTAKTRGELGRVLLESGKVAEAEPTLRAAFTQLLAAEGEKNGDTISAMDHLGLTLQRLGKFEESEHLERRGLEVREELFGPDSLATTYSLNNLANIAQKLGRNQEAADLLQRALDIRRKRLDADHPSVQVSVCNLAVAMVGLKKLDQAEALLNEALGLQIKRLGESHPKTLSTMGNLAFVQEDQGKLDEAERTYRRLIELRRQGRLTDQTAWGDMNNFAMLLQRRGHNDEAESLYRELLPLCEAGLPSDHYITAIFRNNFGDCLTDLRKFTEAEEALLKSQKVIEAFFKPPHARIDKGAGRLAKLYEAWGKPERAEEYRTKITAK